MSVVRCLGQDGRTEWWTRGNDDLHKSCDKWRTCGEELTCDTCHGTNSNAPYVPHLVLRNGDMTTGYNDYFHDLGDVNISAEMRVVLLAVRDGRVTVNCASSRTWSQ